MPETHFQNLLDFLLMFQHRLLNQHWVLNTKSSKERLGHDLLKSRPTKISGLEHEFSLKRVIKKYHKQMISKYN